MLEKSDDVSSLLESRTVEVDFPLVPGDASAMLTKREEFDYRKNRKEFAKWLLLEGKNPRGAVGSSRHTVKRTMYRVSYFERVIWNDEDEYVPVMRQEHADRYIDALAYSEKSQSHKHHTLHSLKRYFKWRHHVYGEPEWEPERSFTISNGQTPQDYFKKPERRRLRQVALDYETIPAYRTVKCHEARRERLKPYVAEYHDITTGEVGVDHWEGVPSWRYTTIVWTSLDAGLRPDEVKKAKTWWVDTENAVLRIPKEEASKSDNNWEVSLREKTAEALALWLHERSHYPKYDDTDRLWLTNHSNPFGARQLGRIIRRLCEEADIDQEHRSLSWYSIRHSVGTYMTREEDLAATQAQLRHKRAETTMKYDAAPAEDRRDALNRMG